MFDFIDGNKNGWITIVEFMTTMDDLGEADDYGKKSTKKYYLIHNLWIKAGGFLMSWRLWFLSQ